METPYATNCPNVVDMVHTEFQDVQLLDEATWQVVVLILKGGGNFGVFGPMEVLWKTMVVILNRHLGASITLPGVLHGLWGGYGTWTVSLEAKLLQKITVMRE